MCSAAKASPVFDDLAAFLRKTVGIADVLRAALEPLRSGIRLAFVYGSVAEGTPGTFSDIDVMIIGDTGFAQVVNAVSTVQARLRREVNPTVMRPSEYAKRRQAGQGFLASVEEKPKIWLIGSDDELARLGAERTTPPAAADARGGRAPARGRSKKHR
jgi:predicted nucleotidyltransferase